MKNSDKNFTAHASKQIAKYSAIIGTGIFLAFCLTRFPSLVFLGFGYVFLATIVNFFALFALMIEMLSNSKDRDQLINAMGIILLNIPLTLVYIFIVDCL